MTRLTDTPVSVMRTFPGGAAQKAELLAAIKADKDADRLAKGQYGKGEGDDFRGCAVGCTIRALGGTVYGDHTLYERLIGVPKEIAFLQDAIFEGLPAAEAMEWPERFTAAIPEDVDLVPAFHRFMAWMLADPQEGCIRFAGKAGRDAIQSVADLHKRAASGSDPTPAEWAAAGSAAGVAAGAAAEAAWAAGSAARSAAGTAAGTAGTAWVATRAAEAAWAAWAAGSAARSAARSAAGTAAGTAWAATRAAEAAWAAGSAAGAAEAAAWWSFANRLIAEIECRQPPPEMARDHYGAERNDG